MTRSQQRLEDELFVRQLRSKGIVIQEGRQTTGRKTCADNTK